MMDTEFDKTKYFSIGQGFESIGDGRLNEVQRS